MKTTAVRLYSLRGGAVTVAGRAMRRLEVCAIHRQHNYFTSHGIMNKLIYIYIYIVPQFTYAVGLFLWDSKLYRLVAKSIRTLAKVKKSTPKMEGTRQCSKTKNLTFHEKECIFTIRTTACVASHDPSFAVWQRCSVASTTWGSPSYLIFSKRSRLTRLTVKEPSLTWNQPKWHY
jgi:hypothetical protein